VTYENPLPEIFNSVPWSAIKVTIPTKVVFKKAGGGFRDNSVSYCPVVLRTGPPGFD